MVGDLVDQSHVLEGRWQFLEEPCLLVDLSRLQFVLF